jgi:hypothetical protein
MALRLKASPRDGTAPRAPRDRRGRGVDPKALLEAIGAMSVPEKVSLVDHAVLMQAPTMADTSPEEG